MAGDKKQVKKADSASSTEKKKVNATASKSASAKAARPVRVVAESGKAVNAGPLRGNNTFPESNKAGSGKHTGGRVGAAADSTSGPVAAPPKEKIAAPETARARPHNGVA